MSSVVFPVLKGLEWPRGKRPMFNTNVQKAVSGRESRVAFMLYPLWQFELGFSVLRTAAAYREMQKIVGLFLQMRGRYDSFLITDDSDSVATDMIFGTRDGSTLTFQLTRTFGLGTTYTFIEPVMNVNVLTNIKSNGVTLTDPADYTISSAGLVTLTAAGTPGHVLTWTGTYYFRCRFAKDEGEFRQFLRDLWEYRRCELIGSPGDRV